MTSLNAKSKHAGQVFVIVEHSDGRPYCYREDEAHHAAAELSRHEQGLKRVEADILDHDCDIFTSLPEDSYIVMRLAPGR